MMEYNILIVEDEIEICNAVEIYLRNQGYHVFKANNGLEGLNIVNNNSIHLAIIDVMMPIMDGIQLTMKIREKYDFPILILSAKSEDIDKITGLNIGADDYITKPFNPIIVGAKVKALIRRSQNALTGTADIITAGPFQYNTSTLRFYKNGEEILLSAKENAIMKLFIDNVNRIFSKDMLYDLIWGESIIDENAIMVYINRLRQKIEEELGTPQYIQTVRGLGYRFVV